MTWICEEHYLVESQTTPDKVYRVNMRLGFCKCVAGLNCRPFVHKSAVAKIHNVLGFSVLPTMDSKARSMCHYIAHGREEKSSWYRPLTQPNEVSNFTDNIEEYGTQAQSGSK